MAGRKVFGELGMTRLPSQQWRQEDVEYQTRLGTQEDFLKNLGKEMGGGEEIQGKRERDERGRREVKERKERRGKRDEKERGRGEREREG